MNKWTATRTLQEPTKRWQQQVLNKQMLSVLSPLLPCSPFASSPKTLHFIFAVFDCLFILTPSDHLFIWCFYVLKTYVFLSEKIWLLLTAGFLVILYLSSKRLNTKIYILLSITVIIIHTAAISITNNNISIFIFIWWCIMLSTSRALAINPFWLHEGDWTFSIRSLSLPSGSLALFGISTHYTKSLSIYYIMSRP